MPQNDDFISNVRDIVSRAGQKRPASTVVQNMDVAATVSKFVRPRDRMMFRVSEEEQASGMMNAGVDQISKTIMGRIEDNENIFRLFPDIELAAQIVISSILSPKDMVKSELIYRTKEPRFSPELTAKLMDIIRTAIDIDYKFLEELPDILRQALFQSGSHVKAILPEAAVDQIINGTSRITTESIKDIGLFEAGSFDKIKSLGLLGNAKSEKPTGRLVFESLVNGTSSELYDPKFAVVANEEMKERLEEVGRLDEFIAKTVEVVDNFHILKLPKLIGRVNEEKLISTVGSPLQKRALKFANETIDAIGKKQISKKEMEGMLYKSPSSVYKPFVNIPTAINLKRKSVGRPLVMDIPSEAAIPVHVPGDCKTHVGYFIPIDVDGNPITVDSVAYDAGQGLNSMLNTDKSNSSLSGLLTEKARRNLTNDGMAPTIDKMTDLYADLIENDLIERLMRGNYGRKLQIARNNEIYRIMLARTLQSQTTRLVYIPAEYVSYFAFNYHRNGVGKSYLDDLSNITSLRAMVLFSRVMAKVKSSIETTSVNVALDPRDPDPVKTIEQAKHLVARARQQYFPHGLNRVVDMTDWIQRAGIQITFSGHPRLPDTKFEFESKNIQHVEPDDSLDEMFRHQTYMHFGLSPETVDTATRTDFATTIENSSVLFSRRIFMLSNRLSVLATDYTRKIIQNDETVIEQMVEALNQHKGELEKNMTDEEKELFTKDPVGFTSYLIQSFLEILEVDLPKPDATKDANQKAAFDSQAELIDKGLDYVFSQGVLPPEFAGQSSEFINAAREAWKAALMREWMADNNYCPELFGITERDTDGKPKTDLLQVTKSYSETLMASIVTFMAEMKAARLAADKDINRINSETGNEASGGDYSSSGSSSSTDDTASGENDNPFGEMGGGDDMFGGAGGDDPFAAPEITEAGSGGDDSPLNEET